MPTPQPPFTALGASALERLLVAVLAIAVLWLLVWWALA